MLLQLFKGMEDGFKWINSQLRLNRFCLAFSHRIGKALLRHEGMSIIKIRKLGQKENPGHAVSPVLERSILAPPPAIEAADKVEIVQSLNS
jgi:hypothetical protein